MGCCPPAPSHYLNQCWLASNGVLWHSPESNFTRIALGLNLQHELENYTFRIIATSPWRQWFKLSISYVLYYSLQVAQLQASSHQMSSVNRQTGSDTQWQDEIETLVVDDSELEQRYQEVMSPLQYDEVELEVSEELISLKIWHG